MQNFLQVNRALAAEKNYYLNLNQIKSNPDGQPTVKANVTPRLPFDKKFFVKLWNFQNFSCRCVAVSLFF